MRSKKKKKVLKTVHTLADKFSLYLGKIPPASLPELGIMGALAYLGFKKFKTIEGILLGPVSLKLAQAPGGTLHVSQIAGVAGLALLGLAGSGGVPFVEPLDPDNVLPVGPPIIPTHPEAKDANEARQMCYLDCHKYYAAFPKLEARCKWECDQLYKKKKEEEATKGGVG